MTGGGGTLIHSNVSMIVNELFCSRNVSVLDQMFSVKDFNCGERASFYSIMVKKYC